MPVNETVTHPRFFRSALLAAAIFAGGLLAGCASLPGARSPGYIEIADERLASHPYFQRLIQPIQTNWELIQQRRNVHIPEGTIVEILVQFAPEDGTVLKAIPRFGTGSLLSMKMCADAVFAASPFGPPVGESLRVPTEVELRFFY